MKFQFCVLILSVLFFSSCQTVSLRGKKTSSREEMQETVDSLKTVAEAMTGKKLTDEEIKALGQKIRTDKETQSALGTITNSLSSPRKVKYCPKTGKRYAPNLTVCPDEGVPLKWVEE